MAGAGKDGMRLTGEPDRWTTITAVGSAKTSGGLKDVSTTAEREGKAKGEDRVAERSEQRSRSPVSARPFVGSAAQCSMALTVTQSGP